MSVPRWIDRRVDLSSTREKIDEEFEIKGRCECGSPKRDYDDDACDHCGYLDQTGEFGAGRVVSALREERLLSVDEISHRGGMSARNVRRHLQRLLEIGRIERVEDEIDTGGNGATMTRWLYRLR